MNDDLATMQLSGQQASVVVGIERAGASLSMIGVLLIVVTFALFKRLRTVPNTFILFASIANIGASTASLIGLSGIAQGGNSTLCRAQAFLLEMFMQSDPMWSFAMAFNVYLVFFHSANPTTFRRHLWVYCLGCFGLPMIPAIVCLYVQNADKGPVYGDATLWCWIGDSWNALRIYSYYIPIWVCIFLSAVIYVAVGYHVFHQRNQLRNLTLSNQAKDLSSSEVRDSADKNLTKQPEIYATVMTEVQITSDVCETALSSERTPPMTPLASPMQCPWSDEPFPQTIDNSTNSAFVHLHDQMHHRIDEERSIGGSHTVSPPPAAYYRGIHSGPSTAAYQATSTTVITSPAPPHGFQPMGQSSRNAHASSAFRLQPQLVSSQGHRPFGHLAHSHHVHRGHLQNRGSRARTSQHISVAQRGRHAWHRFTGKLRHMDPVKLAYLRTSFVFAISVLVTWTPSSINRVYTLVYPARISYGLNIASAAVLPLQGVWNAVIYFSTSWSLLRGEVGRRYARSRWMRRVGGRVHGGLARLRGGGSSGGGGDRELVGMSSGRIPGILIADSGEDGVGGGGGASMGTALSPSRSRSYSQSHLGSSSRSGTADASSGVGPGASAVHGHRHSYDENDTESDGLDGLDGFNEHSTVGSSSPGLRAAGNRRLRPAASMDLGPPPGQRIPRSPPRLGTLRVQRGGQLDT
ncbi:g-protein coupled receptor [Sporothrix brasiliensis 5110]|uniref:G-protein coupled receptor n=1 Tax=Sporothrix brasiliensis 5110 TaxID=1398154 RepID=A0A0C2ISE9_9PEZI|nr:g-protein coupled receptor [Sporothrix brasiliensis 5110]KIH91961.1 g-protein coupled receptor [Sporothrix brasiliensis 5110]